MGDLQKAKFKDHDTLVRWCAEADNEIQHFRLLVNKRNATIKELSKEVHDLETRVAELENSIDEAWGSANAGQAQCYNCATTFLTLDAVVQEQALPGTDDE